MRFRVTIVFNDVRYLYEDELYPSTFTNLITGSSLPANDCIERLSQGLSQAHDRYCQLRERDPSRRFCVLFIVQDPENNVFDQLPLSEKLFQNGVKTFRISLAEVLDQTHILDGDESRVLYFTPPHQRDHVYEVSVCYFRAGYAPSEYSEDSIWKARLLIERSQAVKCPSILTHLAGSKKVQQILATPGSDTLSKYLGEASPSDIARIRQTFTSIYPLDDSAAGKQAVQLASDPTTATNYVLKPQREGGGNNIYGSKIPAFLQSLGNGTRKRRAYILMEMIRPPPCRNVICRNGTSQKGEVICELGVFGVCLWERTACGDTKIINSFEAGHLLRTKRSESEEGGVAAGFGAVDSPCLVDKNEDW